MDSSIFAGVACQSYWAVIGRERWIAFFEFWGDNCVFPFDGEILEINKCTLHSR